MGNCDSSAMSTGAYTASKKQVYDQRLLEEKNQDSKLYDSEKPTDTEQKDCTEYEDKCRKAYEQREEAASKIEESISQDKSHENLLLQFGNVLEMEGVNVHLLGNIMNKVKSDWKLISDSLEVLKKWLGIQEINKLKSLRGEYFSLLIKTKCVVSGLCEESECQSDNINAMLNILNKYEKKQEAEGSCILDTNDSIGYQACFKTLQQWIDQSELQTLIIKWQKITEKLQASQNKIAKAYELYQKKTKGLSIWSKIGIAIAAVIVAGAIIGLIIATSGAAAAIAAGTVKTISIFGTKIVTSHLIAAGISVAGGMLVVGGTYAYGHAIGARSKKVEKIIKMIENMIKQGFFMQKELGELTNVNGKIEKRIKLTNITTLQVGLSKIQQYLTEYQNQGEKVIKVIDEECIKYMK